MLKYFNRERRCDECPYDPLTGKQDCQVYSVTLQVTESDDYCNVMMDSVSSESSLETLFSRLSIN